MAFILRAMRNHLPLLVVTYVTLTPGAVAADFSFDGYVDARMVVPSGEKSWIDGGLGKFRFGAGQPSPNFRFAEAVGQGAVAVTSELHGVVLARLEPEDRAGVDLIESYVSWLPEASGALRWSAKAGAFMPPASLENDDLGWTSPYTLTPSAINSWVGNELRTIGGEGTVEWQGSVGTISAVAALYCCNEPAGTLIAKHGWTLNDRPTGLLERVRAPNTFAKSSRVPVEHRSGLFENIDGNVGWYGSLRWTIPAIGEVAALYYDNHAGADESTSRDHAWRTQFWSLSYRAGIGGVTLLAQALNGDTDIGYSPRHVTRFDSAFALASYDIGNVRLSGRTEFFATRGSSSTLRDEDGHALTAAASWSARSWLRLTGELIQLSSRRLDRALFRVQPDRTDTQFQLSTRLFL